MTNDDDDDGLLVVSCLTALSAQQGYIVLC